MRLARIGIAMVLLGFFLVFVLVQGCAVGAVPFLERHHGVGLGVGGRCVAFECSGAVGLDSKAASRNVGAVLLQDAQLGIEQVLLSVCRVSAALPLRLEWELLLRIHPL